MSEVEKFLKYLEADRGMSPLTVLSYRDGLASFHAFFTQLDEGLDWSNVDSDVVRRWMAARMEGGTKPQTVRRALSALRAFYRYLHMMGQTQNDPMLRVQNPKVARRLPSFVKASEMDRLLDDVQFPDDFRGHRDHLILLTFYSTGLRVSELVGLNVGDVDLSTRELKVTGKRNKQRIVPFGPELAAAFSAFGTERNAHGLPMSGPLFTSRGGKRITGAAVRSMVKAYLSCVTDQQRRTPHVLRHTFATVMLNNGADLEAVKELLGHESLAATEVYTHATFAELKQAYDHAHPRSVAPDDAADDGPAV